MKAIHSFWSAPNRLRHDGEVVIPDYELLTLMLSALKWRELNGSIQMITDRQGAAFFARNGLNRLWDGGISTALDCMEPAPDPLRFWAAGKLFALDQTDAPCVMLDTDLIVWTSVSERLTNVPVAAHREDLEPCVYPDPAEAFSLAESYAFPQEWDFSLRAANTAFLYLPDDALKRAYVDAAFTFMRALRNESIDPTVSMCFAEQRILPMCLAAHGAQLHTLLDDGALDDQRFVTHLWGHKNQLAASPEARIAYCLRCALRIMSDFPEWESVLSACSLTRPYLDRLQ